MKARDQPGTDNRQHYLEQESASWLRASIAHIPRLEQDCLELPISSRSRRNSMVVWSGSSPDGESHRPDWNTTVASGMNQDLRRTSRRRKIRPPTRFAPSVRRPDDLHRPRATLAMIDRTVAPIGDIHVFPQPVRIVSLAQALVEMLERRIPRVSITIELFRGRAAGSHGFTDSVPPVERAHRMRR